MSTAAIELNGVEKQLGKFHLGPLSLTVPRGAIYGLIGPNGAGKSTTLDLLIGLGRIDGGALRILGRDPVVDEVEIKRRAAYVSPDLSFGPLSTVGRAVRFMSGFYTDWDHERCARLQETFGVASGDRISALSFGTRMKLSLILALSRDAELLLLDEPTLGLDAIARRQLFEELLAFMRREDRTILISSHQLTDLERFADHAAIIDRGRLVVSGRMDQLIERYLQLRVRAHEALSHELPGVVIVRRDAGQALIVVDTTVTQPQTLIALGVEVLGEASLTLEDFFLSLAKDSVSQVASIDARRKVS
jgi:ABC-2 type transport system ATP-binding protein